MHYILKNETHTKTKELSDPTAHAEMMAIRKLAEHLKKTDLSAFSLYTTCEPCPMCMNVAIWAKVDALFYGCSIPEISVFTDQIDIRAETLNAKSFHRVAIQGDVLKGECIKLLKKIY
jgi:tRNA(adenine34) deaminase